MFFFPSLARVIHHFPAHIFPNLMMPGNPHKASYFEHRLLQFLFGGDDQARIIEMNCLDDNYFLFVLKERSLNRISW